MYNYVEDENVITDAQLVLGAKPHKSSLTTALNVHIELRVHDILITGLGEALKYDQLL